MIRLEVVLHHRGRGAPGYEQRQAEAVQALLFGDDHVRVHAAEHGDHIGGGGEVLDVGDAQARLTPVVAGNELEWLAEHAASGIDLLDRELCAALDREAAQTPVGREVGVQADQDVAPGHAILVLEQFVAARQQVGADERLEAPGNVGGCLGEAAALVLAQGVDGDAGGTDGLEQLRLAAMGFRALPGRERACRVDEQGPLLRAQGVEDAAADHEHVAQIAVIAQRQVRLHFVDAHRDDGDQRVLLGVDHAIGERLPGGVEVDRDGVRAEGAELVHQHPALHGAHPGAGEVFRAAQRPVTGELLEAVVPEGHADQVDAAQLVEQHLTGLAIEHRVEVFPRRKVERQVGVLHGRDRHADLRGGNQQQVQTALAGHLQHLVVGAQRLPGEDLDLQCPPAPGADLGGEACRGLEQGAVGDVVAKAKGPHHLLCRRCVGRGGGGRAMQQRGRQAQCDQQEGTDHDEDGVPVYGHGPGSDGGRPAIGAIASTLIGI